MELHLKPIARQSSLTGMEFQPGQRVVSLLFLDPGGELRREDLLEEEIADYKTEGTLLCRWARVVRLRGQDDEAVAKRHALGSAEELFLALAHAEAEAEDSGELESVPGPLPAASIPLLRHLLALLLERKRILRAVPGAPGRYRHVKSGEVFTVASVPWEPEELASLSEILQTLVVTRNEPAKP